MHVKNEQFVQKMNSLCTKCKKKEKSDIMNIYGSEARKKKKGG